MTNSDVNRYAFRFLSNWLSDEASIYSPKTGCKEEEKDRAILDEAVMEIPKDDLAIIGGDLNAHVGKARDSYKRHHDGFGYGERNDEGEHVLKFAQAFDLALTNTYYKKKDSHLITYEGGTRKTQLDYMLISSRRLKDVIDCKVIPGEDFDAQHKLLVMDLHLTNKYTQNIIKLEPYIKCGRLK
ncbi:craniofacial development protein 2-like [Gordionus sp. m RMFG-2023]|uniref:craniofacial development protein 2-like n=1 Tax=Gordionus sp. m RMFG-2023 TaxID=3053472 RepID=UPI0031FBFD18